VGCVYRASGGVVDSIDVVDNVGVDVYVVVYAVGFYVVCVCGVYTVGVEGVG
jgi:hypothetical protein